MKREPSKIKNDILLRVRLLYVLFFVAGIVVAGRIVCVQFVSDEIAFNAQRLEKRIFSVETIPAHRGLILARDGEPLATSLFRYQVAFDFASEGLRTAEERYYEQSDSLAKLLAEFFGDRTYEEYRDTLIKAYLRERDTYDLGDKIYDSLVLREDFKKRSFFGRLMARIRGEAMDTLRYRDTVRDHRPIRLFPHPVDYADWEKLRRYPLLNWNMGMIYHLEEVDTRIYPQGGLARRTIGDRGFAVTPKKPDKSDSIMGNYGIDDSFREELTGRDGYAVRQRIARGFYSRVPGSDLVEPINGMDIVTTLDMELQDVADRALRRQLVAQNATWGTTIVMDTKTGEILALANVGRGIGSNIYSERENYALKMTMEPGSTFKLATVLLLLEDAKMSPSKSYDTHNGDPVTVGQAKNIRDSHRGDRVIDLHRAVASSSNVYFAKAVWEMYGLTKKRTDYSRYLHEKLHLGETVGLERFGERQPKITTDWKVADPGIMLVKMSYGYRVQLAPIHVITLYNAIANGGKMITPVLVREMRRDGEVVQSITTQVKEEKIASDATLALVNRYLKAVCTEGTASPYFKDTTRVQVAAKTGTAQVTEPRNEPGRHYLGSMVAFFPADNPRYTVLTTIETKQQAGKAYYGGPLAGPVVKQVVEYICNHEPAWFKPIEQSGAEHRPSQLKGGDMEQMRAVAETLDAEAEIGAHEGWGTLRADSLGRMILATVDTAADEMPDVRGMGLKDALFVLESRGLNVTVSGAGAVTTQSIAPRSAISAGMRVSITLN